MKPLKEMDPQLILDSIYNGIVAINSEGIIVHYNKMAERIFDIPSHEALNRYILDVVFGKSTSSRQSVREPLALEARVV